MADAEIVATYGVHASATQSLRLDTTGMDADTIATYLQEDVAVDATVRDECGRTLSNLEVMGLGGFMVDGVAYVRDEETAHWVVDDGQARTRARLGADAATGDPYLGWERLSDEQVTELFDALLQDAHANDVVPAECWVGIVSAVGYERAEQVWNALHQAVETAARWAIARHAAPRDAGGAAKAARGE